MAKLAPKYAQAHLVPRLSDEDARNPRKVRRFTRTYVTAARREPGYPGGLGAFVKGMNQYRSSHKYVSKAIPF